MGKIIIQNIKILHAICHGKNHLLTNIRVSEAKKKPSHGSFSIQKWAIPQKKRLPETGSLCHAISG
jgi:hypothetical protein